MIIKDLFTTLFKYVQRTLKLKLAPYSLFCKTKLHN